MVHFLTGLSCGKPPSVRKAQSQYQSTNFGAVVTYVCNTGYTLSGASQRTCRGIGKWDDVGPKCCKYFFLRCEGSMSKKVWAFSPRTIIWLFSLFSRARKVNQIQGHKLFFWRCCGAQIYTHLYTREIQNRRLSHQRVYLIFIEIVLEVEVLDVKSNPMKRGELYIVGGHCLEGCSRQRKCCNLKEMKGLFLFTSNFKTLWCS